MSGVQLIGMQKIVTKLNSLEQMHRILGPVMLEGGEQIKREAQNQPPKKAGAFSELATEGQRRAYWAKVRSGEAMHGPSGYIRSGNLKNSWEKPQMTKLADGVRVTVTNSASYAGFVHSQLDQQPFHKASGFPTEGPLIDRVGKDILRAAENAVRRELNR